MKHSDGVQVSIRRRTGERFKEFTNPHEKRHDKFMGAFGSRLITSVAGEPFEILVTLDQTFNIYKAKGVLIVIACGSQTELLSRQANLQCFWLDASRMNIIGEHKFSTLTLWSSQEADSEVKEVPMRMPPKDRK